MILQFPAISVSLSHIWWLPFLEVKYDHARIVQDRAINASKNTADLNCIPDADRMDRGVWKSLLKVLKEENPLRRA